MLDSRAALDFAILSGFPIVATNWDEDSFLTGLLPDGVERIGGTNTEPDVESILSFNPDMLVVGSGWFDHYREHGLLNFDMAPTFVVAQGDPTSRWREVMTQQLHSIGRGNEASQVLLQYEQQLDASRRQIGSLLDGKKVAIGGAWQGEYWLQGDTFCTSVAEDLGMTLVRDTSTPPRDGNWFYSAETISVFNDADLIIMQNIDAPEVEAPTWQRIPAVTAGHVAELTYDNNNGLALTAIDFAKSLADSAQLLR
ncbi:ABC transporter substrate-binding protein [Hoyosella altamirensis]|uniref:Iron complex transport system substrate-binding protein n=1 Tax=Hoyosella altamirensis TaxID=616997 RepID=A0A839RJN3_9ACTN|nr:ABC transporter substrate-binding protein [Hoyosella altamirensis]MBB3037032.1 iron complex transport system substrate-binding protein [Hoyosella altamirensis]